VIHSRKAHIWTRPGRAAFGGTSVKQETESPSAGAKPREVGAFCIECDQWFVRGYDRKHFSEYDHTARREA